MQEKIRSERGMKRGVKTDGGKARKRAGEKKRGEVELSLADQRLQERKTTRALVPILRFLG